MKVFKLFLFLTVVVSYSFLFAIKKCPQCGKEYSDDYNYCTKCGSVLDQYLKIPNVVGRDKDEAINLLESKGFYPVINEEFSEAPTGTVIKQSPPTGIKKEGSTILLWVSAGPMKPKWLRKLESIDGWPVAGKQVAEIFVGSSIGRHPLGNREVVLIIREDSTKVVIDTLEKPDYEEKNWLCYRSGSNELKIFSQEGKVDTIMVLMSDSLRIELKLVLENIEKNLPMPEVTDSIQRSYPGKGISFLIRSDAVNTPIWGVKIFAPRKDPAWIKMLKKYGVDSKSLTIAGLRVGMYADSAETLFGKPNFETLNTWTYEFLENRLILSIGGGEIDTISLFLSRKLLDSLSLKIPPPNYYITNREELVYPDSGFTSIYENGVLLGIKMYTPEHSNMVLIPAGYFLLGTSKQEINKMRKKQQWDWDFSAETPQKRISLNYDFYIDKYEVTNRQFKKFIKATGYKPKGNWENWYKNKRDLDNRPVAGVTWDDAQAYAEWAGKRLPNEIEWEKAARCSLGYWFPWGNSMENAPKLANYRYSGGRDTSTRVPVDTFAEGKSSYGVFNMAGNVWEWCANPYIENYYKVLPVKINTPEEIEKIPAGAKLLKENDTLISVRGGSCCSDLFSIRSAYRSYFTKDESRGDLGFRCVKDVKRRRKNEK